MSTYENCFPALIYKIDQINMSYQRKIPEFQNAIPTYPRHDKIINTRETKIEQSPTLDLIIIPVVSLSY